MRREIFKLITSMLLIFLAGSALAHPLAPSLLELRENDSGLVEVKWKTPLKSAPGSRISPVLPAHCQQVSELTNLVEGTGRVYLWQVNCASQGLVGHAVGVEEIRSSKTNAMVRVQLQDGRRYMQMLTPDQPAFVVPARQSVGQVFFQYLKLGVEHLLTGIDHMLFVVALTMLVGINRSLVWTITLFTIGHSITLSLAALGFVSFSEGFAEVLIALSIVVAVGGVIDEGRRDWLSKRPWLMAGSFGLLHGLGFAGALTEVGLPQEEIPMALAAFNVGLELGQLALVGLMLLVVWLARRLNIVWQGWWRSGPAWAMGLVASFWFWERLVNWVA
ncbi:MAG: HupE/UreJ family protein [Pseudomonadales bacterium]